MLRYGSGPDQRPLPPEVPLSLLSPLPFSVLKDQPCDAKLKPSRIKMRLGPAASPRVFGPLLSQYWVGLRSREVSRAATPP